MPHRQRGTRTEAGVGVCVRERGAVVFQNATCMKVCGAQRGLTCGRACVGGEGERWPLRVGRVLHGVRCDLAVFEGDAEGVTVLVPREAELARHEEVLRRHGLTPREREVATLALLGWTNAEIAQAAGLTRATVRTHLNRAHQKLPEGFLARARVS